MAEYIEREKLLESLKGSEKKLNELYDTARTQDVAKSCYGQLIMLTECILRIKEQPAAEVEPVRHGRWKHYKKQGVAVCMECSFERNLDENFGRAIACPNCGARMDLGGADNG